MSHEMPSEMAIEHSPDSTIRFANAFFENRERRTIAGYERELTRHRHVESTLRRALARDEALLRQKDASIQQQKILSKESDHRFLNGMQMVVSLGSVLI
jgi:hypothetical protein